MQPAFGYLRVSSLSQAAEGRDGLPRQRDAIQTYAAANDMEIVRWFEDRGVGGGTDADARPAWVEMLGQILAAGVRSILIEKLDRLARDLLIQEHIILDVRRLGVDLVSTCDRWFRGHQRVARECGSGSQAKCEVCAIGALRCANFLCESCRHVLS